MKYIIFFLLISFTAIGQRDTLNQSKVNKSYDGKISSDYDTMYYKMTWKENNIYYNVTDTFDVNDITVLEYIDSLLTIAKNDSIITTIDVNNFFDAYKTRNSYLTSLKNYIAKLYAIRQEFE